MQQLFNELPSGTCFVFVAAFFEEINEQITSKHAMLKMPRLEVLHSV